MKREGLLEGPTKKRAAVVRLNVREAHFDVAPETLAAATSFQAGLAGDTPMAAAHTVTIGADVPSAGADDPGDDLAMLQDAVVDADGDAKPSAAAKRSLERRLANAEAQGIGSVITYKKSFD